MIFRLYNWKIIFISKLYDLNIIFQTSESNNLKG